MARPHTAPSRASDYGLVSDELLPSVPVLLGPDGAKVLDSALTQVGATVESARPRFVLYRPGERITVRYWGRVRWANGKASNTTLVATERRAGPPDGTTHVETAGTTVGVWQWPYDPWLPGLRAATDPKYVRQLLDAYGAPPGRLYLRTMSYWPGRRAVTQVTIPSRKLRLDAERGRLGRAPDVQLMFVKTVRPGEAQPLYELHSRLRAAAPVALCPGGSDEHGLLVLQALPGATLGQWIERNADEAPAGERIVELMRRIGPYELRREPRSTTRQRIESHVRLLKAVVPDQAEALDGLVEAYGNERPEPMTTVHGDFHESQLLVGAGGDITGLLDVDDAGPGQLVDDLAQLAGRVWALSYFGNGDRAATRRYAERLVEAFGAAVDGRELRRRMTGSLLGRATVPFRAQDRGWPAETRRRIGVAEEWLEQCRRDGVLD
jgi:phosphotransferase family enzyme